MASNIDIGHISSSIPTPYMLDPDTCPWHWHPGPRLFKPLIKSTMITHFISAALVAHYYCTVSYCRAYPQSTPAVSVESHRL